jgi:TolB protein
MKHPLVIAALALVAAGGARAVDLATHAQLFEPDLVSTPQAEVRIAFSPDGQRMLWGTIDWVGGRGGWDIFESHRIGHEWSKPSSAAFNSSANDFDPSFATDGSGVFFFSNREGGVGKDDLYFARFDKTSQQFAPAANLGAAVNTSGDEWAPVMSKDGKRLMFASDGRGGAGKHDLFIASLRGGKWQDVVPVAALNSADEDFDAAFLDDDQSIVFSRGDFAGEVALYVAEFREGKLSSPQRLSKVVNSEMKDAWTFGPSISLSEPRVLYFTSRHEQNRGRADIYRIEYSIGGALKR